MKADEVSNHLQVIRTLMERGALYRRALAPIFLAAGLLGLAAATAGLFFRLDSLRGFTWLWLGTAALAVAVVFLLARQQAVQEREPFWSAPTRRVAMALVPPLASGLWLGLIPLIADLDARFIPLLALLWMLFYGCALQAAGFFTTRGIRILGWLFIAGASGLLAWMAVASSPIEPGCAHLIMGGFFGVLHLACSAYLYITEKRKNVA